MNPEQLYMMMVQQGMSPQEAAQRSGFMPQPQAMNPGAQPFMQSDVAGMLPGIGSGMDAANAAQQAMQGNFGPAGMAAAGAAAGMIPGVGGVARQVTSGPMPKRIMDALGIKQPSWSGNMGSARQLGEGNVDIDDMDVGDARRRIEHGWNKPYMTDDEKRTMIRGRATDRLDRNIRRRESGSNPMTERIEALIKRRPKRAKAKRDWNRNLDRTYDEEILTAPVEDRPPMLGRRKR